MQEARTKSSSVSVFFVNLDLDLPIRFVSRFGGGMRPVQKQAGVGMLIVVLGDMWNNHCPAPPLHDFHLIMIVCRLPGRGGQM